MCLLNGDCDRACLRKPLQAVRVPGALHAAHPARPPPGCRHHRGGGPQRPGEHRPHRDGEPGDQCRGAGAGPPSPGLPGVLRRLPRDPLHRRLPAHLPHRDGHGARADDAEHPHPGRAAQKAGRAGRRARERHPHQRPGCGGGRDEPHPPPLAEHHDRAGEPGLHGLPVVADADRGARLPGRGGGGLQRSPAAGTLPHPRPPRAGRRALPPPPRPSPRGSRSSSFTTSAGARSWTSSSGRRRWRRRPTARRRSAASRRR